MFDFLPTALILIAASLVGFLAYVATLPSEFRIERSLAIDAPPETIFPLINDLRNFNRWNPFLAADPAAKLVYRGADTGVGAAYDWNSTGRAGAGSMIITNSAPSSRVNLDLNFSKPFVANNVVEFLLTPAGRTTTVSWVMSGRRPFFHKLMGTLFNMDKMVGGEFAKGLASLKALAEAPTA